MTQVHWLGLCWLLMGTAFADGLPSAVSTNLCADLWLTQLGAPEQIVALSQQSHNVRLSPIADVARHYPSNRGSVEELLVLKPARALVYQGWNGQGRAHWLAQHGIELVAPGYPITWNDTLNNAQQVADALGGDPAQRTLIEQIDAQMQALRGQLPPYRVVYLRPNGGSAGRGTYIDDLLQHLGLRNLAAEQGLRGWGRVSLEQLLIDPPDLLLLGYFDQPQAITQSGYARHPLTQALFERLPTLSIPATAWGCGGLELVDTARLIVERVQALDLQLEP